MAGTPEDDNDNDNDNDNETRRRRALKDAFGDSSDEDSGDGDASLDRPLWETVDGVNGLWLCAKFLNHDQQSWLLSAIHREGWFTESGHNQAMRFGNLPDWALEVSRLIREAVCHGRMPPATGKASTIHAQYREDYCPLPSKLLWREPLFDQLIANAYEPGEGICAHVDLMRFDDGIAIVSLESACVMHFTRAYEETVATERQGDEVAAATKVPVLLSPGSLVLMSGEARYLWMHEINRKPGFQTWQGHELHQQKRTSVTLRRLCRSPD